MKILFINHKKSQCGIYELGRRIYSLIVQEMLPSEYEEVGNLNDFYRAIHIHKPDAIVYNYYPGTLPFLNSNITKLLPKIKHFGIIHDPLDPLFISDVESMFDAWIIHDDTNPLPSAKKFKTIRPVPRYTRTSEIDLNNISIGTHGFPVSLWKMYDTIVEYINASFDNVVINMNLTLATYGGKMEQVHAVANKCRSMVTKPGVKLNITHDYIPTELGMVDWLAKNTMNIYFYNAPSKWVGVGASADLAIASQSSLVVNDSYMYRHISAHLGYGEKHTLHNFLDNKEKVRKLYTDWSPERMTSDYKTMIEKVAN